MKKLLAVLLLVVVSVGVCTAEEATPRKVREGLLVYSNMPVEEYGDFLDVNLNQNLWNIYGNCNPA